MHVRLELNDGNVGQPAVRKPSTKELREYVRCIKSELDDFVGDTLRKRHLVIIVFDDLYGIVCPDVAKNIDVTRNVDISAADTAESKQLELTRQRLRTQRSQCVYFNRNLRIYEGTTTFIVKPMQRFHWTYSHAILDARQIIAETLSPSERDE